MRATTPPLNLNLRRTDYLPASRGASALVPSAPLQPVQQLHVEAPQMQHRSAVGMTFAAHTRLVTPQLLVDGASSAPAAAASRTAIVGPSRNYSLPPPPAAAAAQPYAPPSTVPVQMPLPAKDSYQGQHYMPMAGGSGNSSGAPQGMYESRPVQQQQQQEFIHATIHQWTAKMQQETSAMEQAEALLAAEEAGLRAKAMELDERRQQLDREQLAVNHGWSTLYELEERYHTELPADRSQAIADGEYRCAVLQERFHEAQLQLDLTARQLEAFAYVAARKQEQAVLLERLARGFEQVERRRAGAILRAEQLLEVECQRERKCAMLAQTLDTEIRTISVTAGLPAPSSSSRLPSVADGSRQPPQRSRIVSFDKTPETVAVPAPAAGNMAGLDCDSVCYGLGDDDGLGDASVMYSICNLKKPRMEAAPPSLVR